MKDTPAVSANLLLAKVAAVRFFTGSLLVHIVLVILLGGAVLFHVENEVPDFAAGSEGFLGEDAEAGAAAPPPSAPAMEAQTFTPTSQPLEAPNLSAITATTQQATSFSMSPATSIPSVGITDSMKQSMASMGSGDALGKIGSTLQSGLGGTRTGSIFGKKVTAKKLGVILDVSGSAHPYLASAIEEIQKTFPDAIMILYPGCGISAAKGRSPHDIRKLSSIPDKEIEVKSEQQFTTPAQLQKALMIKEFEKLVERDSNRDTLYVSWYVEKGKSRGSVTGSAGGLTGHTAEAFEELKKMEVDTIYWFADFQDAIHAETAEDLVKSLRRKKITVHVNNFSGGDMKKVEAFAEETGGTVTSEKMGGKK